MTDTKDKPVVHFHRGPEFREYIDTDTAKKVELATVYGVVDHPRLGFQHVIYTSQVLAKCEDGLSFETLNTIYRKVLQEGTEAPSVQPSEAG